jgi:cbb3-type cytochrome oxidase subunit 1
MMDSNIIIYGLIGASLIFVLDYIIERIPKLKSFKNNLRNVFYVLGIIVSIIGIISAFNNGFKSIVFCEYIILLIILIIGFKVGNRKKKSNN